MTSEFDDVSKARHYNTHPSGVECRDISLYLPHPLASAFEYVWRYEDKGGTESLLKALQWLEFLEGAVMAGYMIPQAPTTRIINQMFAVVCHEPDKRKAAALQAIFQVSTTGLPLQSAIERVQELIDDDIPTRSSSS